jgi:hypothetical protein
MSITPASGVSFDASQFKLQADGTFRISIRGMAAMAGIAESGLRASLKSAAHENPLPCAKSLLAQGFTLRTSPHGVRRVGFPRTLLRSSLSTTA